MKTIEYPISLQWVKALKCQKCSALSLAWMSSGMSQLFPHFYCDRCSNVLRRLEDHLLVYQAKSQELLDQITQTLPDCPCGGRFRPGANPRCLHCGAAFPHSTDLVARLHDPHMIAVDGACVFVDGREPYQVRIVKESKQPNQAL